MKGKKVIVTGGAQGLGLSIAENFLKNGANLVIIPDIEEHMGITAASELNKKHGDGKAVFMKCDVTKDLEKVSSEIISTYKYIDILVNNAGSVKEDSVKATFELNVLALVEWSMKFYEYMRTDKGGIGGTIMNVSSICAITSTSFVPFYTASKYAVLGFTKSKGHIDTYAKTGVRMVTLCPGLTATTLTKTCPDFIKDKELVAYMKTAHWQDPDAVGAAAVEVYERAKSGTVWSIVEGKLVEQLDRAPIEM